jgi:hypothetical protein
MKSIKTIFSIALIALATSSFGQGAYHGKEFQTETVRVNYNTGNHSIVNKISNFLDKFSKPEKVPSLKPVVCMSFTLDQAEIIYEDSYKTEKWMTIPFSISVPEAEPKLESWMSDPFYSRLAEADLPIESWMSTPFKTAEPIEIENWMTAAWN